MIIQFGKYFFGVLTVWGVFVVVWNGLLNTNHMGIGGYDDYWRDHVKGGAIMAVLSGVAWLGLIFYSKRVEKSK